MDRQQVLVGMVEGAILIPVGWLLYGSLRWFVPFLVVAITVAFTPTWVLYNLLMLIEGGLIRHAMKGRR